MQTILNTEVSLYVNYTEPYSDDTISLLDWLTADGYKNEIMEIRKCKSVDKVKSLKKHLPAITPSGVFYPKRTSDTLKVHSGFICVDIDSKQNPNIQDWNAAKKSLQKCKNIAYTGLSASGKGIFVLIPIAYPDRHIEHFYAIEYYFLEEHSIHIDTACKNKDRLRGISYDDDAYFNHNADPMFTCLQSANLGSLRRDNPQPDSNTVKKILNEVLSLKTDITESYRDWFSIGCVIANTYGETGREMYHDVSRLSPKYKQAECDKQYSACLKTPYSYTVGTLIHLLNKYR